MIETIQNIANQAGMEKVNVSIESSAVNRASVVIQFIPKPLVDDISEEQRRLRDILATPLIIEGVSGEIEAKLEEVVYDYLKKTRPALKTLEKQLANIDEAADSVNVDPDVEDDVKSKETAFTHSI